jgi:hypothetical protein
MSIQVLHKTVDIVLTESAKGKFASAVIRSDGKHGEDDRVLRLHFSLMGETSPALSPLSADYSIEHGSTAYRYDWIVGASLIEPSYKWNWFNEIANERAVIVQLLIDPGHSECGFSESNAFLLGLQPSLNTASWAERNATKLGESLAKLSNITEPFSKITSNILKTSALMSNFVSSDDKGDTGWFKRSRKNWFLYRFLDEKRKCCAVEWNISRNVMHQYGPLLRGSILLAFHGNPKPEKPLMLLLRPRLNFGNSAMDYVPPIKELEEKEPVALSINPVSG